MITTTIIIIILRQTLKRVGGLKPKTKQHKDLTFLHAFTQKRHEKNANEVKARLEIENSNTSPTFPK